MESNLNIAIEDYNGPLDVLLELVNKNKYDIKKLPILDLCNQYLRFIDNIKSVNIDLASEYLLMAAIMIYLKSKFLVNKDKEEDVKKVTRFLTNRLTILEMLNKNSKKLFELPKFEEDFFPNKNKFKLKVEKSYIIKDKLFDLLKAYTNIYRRNQNYTLKFSSIKLFSIKDGQKVLNNKISSFDDWFSLDSLMPDKLKNDLLSRSFISSTFGAGLQMAKKNQNSEKTLVIKQSMPFKDIYYKKYE